jgi:1,4-alpha-glucan branching enzyme
MSKHGGGATAARKKHHTVSLAAPEARSVVVTGSFCDWSSTGHPLKHAGNGVWTANLGLPPGRYEYRFVVDGEWRDDPGCTERVPNPFGSTNGVFQL